MIFNLEIIKQFWSKVEKTDSCWNWLAGKANGYGRFYNGIKNIYAHRFAYELLVNKIPEGLTIDHLCRNRACVNPDHLEPTTLIENVMRGNSIIARYARQTHCIRGHPLTPYNIYIMKNHPRVCKICQRERKHRWREKNLERMKQQPCQI